MRPDGGVDSGFGGGECTHTFTRRQVTLLPLLVVNTYISGASGLPAQEMAEDPFRSVLVHLLRFNHLHR